MLGCFLSRILLIVLGYAYPAYKCYKTTEDSKSDTKKLKWWCRYWILVTVVTVVDQIGVVSWLPFFGEVELAFLVCLWYSKTMGADYVYKTLFKPFMVKHERKIDKKLEELKRNSGRTVIRCCYQATTYWNSMFINQIVREASGRKKR